MLDKRFELEAFEHSDTLNGTLTDWAIVTLSSLQSGRTSGIAPPEALHLGLTINADTVLFSLWCQKARGLSIMR